MIRAMSLCLHTQPDRRQQLLLTDTSQLNVKNIDSTRNILFISSKNQQLLIIFNITVITMRKEKVISKKYKIEKVKTNPYTKGETDKHFSSELSELVKDPFM